MRFGVPWVKLTSTLINDERPAWVLAQTDERPRETRSRAEIVFAIQSAARWLGTDHISQQTYERARLEISEAVRFVICTGKRSPSFRSSRASSGA
ncbi:MAG TPA: hypothetical protein VLJ42_01035 [Solirubrobacteraceae bacterium]|nr:hypothetical protein [Solirubrobacteraceae bacterium]